MNALTLKTKRTRVHRSTWLGRPGEAYEILLTSSALGRRVDVHRWTDTNEVVVRAITGDAWKGRRPYRQFSEEVLRSPTQQQVDEAVRCAIANFACVNCGHVHSGACPYVSDPATCACGADHFDADEFVAHEPTESEVNAAIFRDLERGVE